MKEFILQFNLWESILVSSMLGAILMHLTADQIVKLNMRTRYKIAKIRGEI